MSDTQIHGDFFGQFIKKDFRVLRRQDVQRFIDRIFILCPECQRHLPIVPSDDYLLCSFCSIHWDLLLSRPLVSPDYTVDSRLRPDGSLYRRKVVDKGQIPLEIPF